MKAQELLMQIYPHLNLNREKKRYLRKKWIINGTWAANGINFSFIGRKIILILQELKPFNADYFHRLINDIDKGSDNHDIEYFEGNTFLERLTADWRYAKYVSRLIRSWAGYRRSIYVFIAIFFVLFRYGGDAYNYGEKRSVHKLLCNMNKNEHKYR